MPKTPTTLTYRRRILIERVTAVNILSMRSCDNCIRASQRTGVTVECKIALASDRCTEYVQKNRPSCSSAPFSPAR